MRRHKLQKRILSVFLVLLIVMAGSLSVSAKDKIDVDSMIAALPESWPEGPDIPAETAVLMDANSGEVLYAKNATEKAYPASTTKLLTALLALENLDMDEIIMFSASAVNIPSGSSHIGMRRGEKMSVRDCLYGLLLPSANEVANALAEAVSGSVKAFTERMNERAYQLGAVNTVFKNANGLHTDNHYTCAYDLALFMRACIQNNTFIEIASTPSYVRHKDEMLEKDIPMTNTDAMIRPSSEYYNPNIVCGKTGHTDESGYNLVTYAENNGVRLIAVVMGCSPSEHYVATQSLLDYGFHYFKQVLPAELDTSLAMERQFTSSPLKIPVRDVSLLSLTSSETILLPENVTFDMLVKEVEKTEDGMKITYKYQDYPLGSVSLSSQKENEKNGMFAEKEKDEVEETAEPPESGTVINGWLLVVLVLLILLSVFYIYFIRKVLYPRKKFE